MLYSFYLAYRSMNEILTDLPILIVDDDDAMRDALTQLLLASRMSVTTYASGQSFLDASQYHLAGCILLDISMPGMNGLEVQKVLQAEGCTTPIIFLSGHGDIPMAVEAIRSGALDFLEKPVPGARLIALIHKAVQLARAQQQEKRHIIQVRQAYEKLTPREREVFAKVTAGNSNKQIALQLGISHRTVEVHRNNLMQKMAANNLAELIRLAQYC
ncbi:MAG: response regulator [Reinekea sp.]